MYGVELTHIKGLMILTPRVFPDSRGCFFEAFNKKALANCGIEFDLRQENHVVNLKAGVFRGLHFQNAPYEQAKLVRCIKGRVWDVAVDLRSDSPTYLQYVAVELSDDNMKQFYLPKGFAHGVLSLEDNTEVTYYTDEFWMQSADRTVKFDDEQIGIEYPLKDLILSDKDRNAPALRDSGCNL